MQRLGLMFRSAALNDDDGSRRGLEMKNKRGDGNGQDSVGSKQG
jgi:hypothetical protein